MTLLKKANNCGKTNSRLHYKHFYFCKKKHKTHLKKKNLQPY